MSDNGVYQQADLYVAAIVWPGRTGTAKPERLRGVAHDHRADIWSIGVMFYQSLTNRNPFSEHDSAKVASILHDPLPPLKGVPGGFAAGLNAVLKKALAKNPENRYDSSQEMASALEQIEQNLVDPGRDPLGEVRSFPRLPKLFPPETHALVGTACPILMNNSGWNRLGFLKAPSLALAAAGVLAPGLAAQQSSASRLLEHDARNTEIDHN